MYVPKRIKHERDHSDNLDDGKKIISPSVTQSVQCKYTSANANRGKESSTAIATPNQKGMPQGLKSGLENLSGYDLSSVRVHYNSQKPKQLGALAYAQGTNIHLGAGQEKHLPHEGWHVVQQMQGRVKPTMQMKETSINNDCGLEREADVMGVKATNIKYGTGKGESKSSINRTMYQQAIQCYTPKKTSDQAPDNWNAGKKLRISDDGNMAVAQDSKYGSHDMWALPSVISTASGVLAGKRSVMRLSAGGSTIKGDAPDASGAKTLSKVEPENVHTKTQGTGMTIWADCGRSGRDIMGAGRGSGRHYGSMAAVYNKERGSVGKFFGRSSMRKTSASGPEAMAAEVYRKLGGKSVYDALSSSDKDAFDKKAGINRYAAPEVGEGYTMASGGVNYPGKETWNFHWAGVIMVSGGDSVTLENFATGVPTEKNTDWDFQMYGPSSKANQTFHDQHKATKQHGDAPSTLKVRKR